MRKANLCQATWNTLRDAWKLKEDLRGKDAKRLCRDLFRYGAAITHAPQYETDHKDSLAQDWPRIPISKDRVQFEEIVKLGEKVSCLLNPLGDAGSILKATLGKDAKTLGVVQRVGGGSVGESDLVVEYSYYGAATGKWDERAVKETEAARPEWGDLTGDLYLNESIYLGNVPAELWRYELGGYPVLKKWLGYRQSNRRGESPLTLKELDELRAIIHRIAALLILRPQLDAAYQKVTEDAWLTDDFQESATLEAPKPQLTADT